MISEVIGTTDKISLSPAGMSGLIRQQTMLTYGFRRKDLFFRQNDPHDDYLIETQPASILVNPKNIGSYLDWYNDVSDETLHTHKRTTLCHNIA